MKVNIVGTIFSVFMIGGFAAIASIPEPDVVLYGPVFFDGVMQTQADTDVSIIARVVGVSDPVGMYVLGDKAIAGNDSVLRIRLESLADGASQSNNTALIGQTVQIMIKKGATEKLAQNFVVPDRGHIQNIQLDTRALGDFNADDVVSLSDFPSFVGCMSGANATATLECEAVFDFDSNAIIDLRDLSGFLTTFTGD